LFGTLQFWLAKPLFGKIGDRPKKSTEEDAAAQAAMGSVVDEEDVNDEINKEKPNPFTMVDKILIALTAVIGLGYAINDPLSKIAGLDLFAFASVGSMPGQYTMVLIALALFLILVISRISRYSKGVRERMIAFIIFAFFTVFFFTCFEQGASSLIIFARDYVDRSLSGGAAFAYNLINTLLTTIPLAIITYVLYLLARQTFKKIPGSNIVLAITFIGVWGLTLWMLNRDWNTSAYLVSYDQMEQPVLDEDGEVALTDGGDTVFQMRPVTENMVVKNSDQVSRDTLRIGEVGEFEIGEQIPIITKEKDYSNFGYLPPNRLEWARNRALEMGVDNGVVIARVEAIKNDEVEITVSWFSILNSFFIIAFAPFFSRWFDSRYNPSAAHKYGLGLIIMAIGFGLLAWGSSGIASGVKVSMIWLILAYLFHTLGELSLSPVGFLM
jgi:POT family proton-dependent oligopeptide transporter